MRLPNVGFKTKVIKFVIMTKEKAIKFLQQLYPNGGHCWLDEQRIEAIGMAIKALQKDPVSEDLEQAIDTYLSTYFGGEKEKQEWPFLKKMAIHFAKWQKEQFENNRLKHCDSITNEQAELEQGFIDQHLDKYQRMPTFLDAIEYGMRLQKEQMMAKAVDGVVHRFDRCGVASVHYNDPNGVPMAYFISSEELSAGDKVKIITIKED